MITDDLTHIAEAVARTADRCWPSAMPEHHAIKLQKEAAELGAAQGPDQIEEAADCLICLLNYCNDRNISAELLGAATFAKLAKCERRTWRRQPDGTYQHVEPRPIGECGGCGGTGPAGDNCPNCT